MVVQLKFDRESLNTTLQLLHLAIYTPLLVSDNNARALSAQEALKRVFDQLPREYSDA